MVDHVASRCVMAWHLCHYTLPFANFANSRSIPTLSLRLHKFPNPRLFLPTTTSGFFFYRSRLKWTCSFNVNGWTGQQTFLLNQVIPTFPPPHFLSPPLFILHIRLPFLPLIQGILVVIVLALMTHFGLVIDH